MYLQSLTNPHLRPHTELHSFLHSLRVFTSTTLCFLASHPHRYISTSLTSLPITLPVFYIHALPLTPYLTRLASHALPHALPLTPYLSRLTSHALPLTPYLSRLTSHALPLTPYLPPRRAAGGSLSRRMRSWPCFAAGAATGPDCKFSCVCVCVCVRDFELFCVCINMRVC
jgi:hypothetical protein